MDQAAFWMSLSAIIGSFLTAVVGIANSYFNTKPKMDAMRDQIDALQKRERTLTTELDYVKDKHKDCERHREQMQGLLIEIMGEKLKGDKARNDRDALADSETPPEHFG